MYIVYTKNEKVTSTHLNIDYPHMFMCIFYIYTDRNIICARVESDISTRYRPKEKLALVRDRVSNVFQGTCSMPKTHLVTEIRVYDLNVSPSSSSPLYIHTYVYDHIPSNCYRGVSKLSDLVKSSDHRT